MGLNFQKHNKRIYGRFSAALQTSHKCGRYHSPLLALCGHLKVSLLLVTGI